MAKVFKFPILDAIYEPVFFTLFKLCRMSVFYTFCILNYSYNYSIDFKLKTPTFYVPKTPFVLVSFLIIKNVNCLYVEVLGTLKW